MSQPAGLRSSSSPFVRQKRKSGGKKLGLDMTGIEPSYNHKERDASNHRILTRLRLELIQAEREGKHSKAKKVRRAINHMLEEGIYLTHSFCLGCNNVLHNCQCQN